MDDDLEKIDGQIPIQNIYHLLSYVWTSLNESGEIDVDANDCHSIEELLTRILVNGTQRLLKNGLDSDYILHSDETSRLKGRFDLTSSFSRQTMQQGRMVCEYDELSSNVLHNQILKTTVELVFNNNKLSNEYQNLLRRQKNQLRYIQSVDLTKSIFRRVKLHRNNRQYKLLMNVCELINSSLLPTEHAGKRRFRNFIRDKASMHSLFESFVRNFYKKHANYKVVASHLKWDIGESNSTEVKNLVPRLETDVSLYREDRQIILDCKFYKEAFSNYYGSKSFKRDHLFQIFAYLENAEHSKGWNHVEGVLLYPSVSKSFHHQFQLNGHQVTIASVDLDQPWKDIERQLLQLVA